MELKSRAIYLCIILITFTLNLHATKTDEPITIIGYMNGNPFSFSLPDGTPTGLYIEYWKLWSKANDIPINIVMARLNDGIDAVNNKRTMHAMLFKSESRSERFDYSLPFHSINTGILYKKRYLSNTILENKKGLKVAVQIASFQYNYLSKNYPLLELVTVVDMEAGIDQLLDNKVDALVGEIPHINVKLGLMGLNGVFTLSDEILHTNTLHAAIAKGQPKLLAIINKGIENIPIKAVVELEKKWLPSIEPYYKDATTFSALTIAEIKWLQQQQSLSIGIDPDLPPFEFVDNDGNFAGLASDYISYANELLGINMEPKYGLTWLEAFDAFKKGEIDIMSGAIVTKERLKQMNFTEPYIDMPTAIITRRNSFYAENMSSLNHKTLGLVGGDFVQFVRNDYPDINIKIVDSEVIGLELLQAGKIDAFMAPIAVANYELDKRDMNDLIIAAFSPYNLKLSIAIRKGLEPLVPILNKTFANMTEKQQSTLNNIWLRSYIKTGIDKRDIITWGFPVVFLFLLIIITIIVQANKRLKLVLEKNRALARRIVAIQEEERKLLSRDLHDEIGQNLTALRLHINIAKQSQDAAKLSSVIKSIDEIISITYQSAYELMHWLRPIVLDDYGLKHALSNHIFTKMLKESKINYILDVVGNLNQLDGELTSSIYRIVQECISNTTKHSKAKNLWVTIKTNSSELVMEIKDDGIGFNIEDINRSINSFGLRGIQDRADAMNGVYNLYSDDRGTIFDFKFKLDFN